jgi:uncharacterized protein with ParB-like and HNH nuclease domain
MQGIKSTSTDTFRKILGNGLTYEVPKFQQDYSWQTEQWDDLWQDLLDLHHSETKAHYMGYLVLQTANSKQYQIIDGQQRITTLSLLILAILKQLKHFENSDIEKENNAKRREQLRMSYIGYLNPVTLVPNNKLKLNRNNDAFYKTYLVQLSEFPLRGLNPSERLMKACFEWFSENLAKTFDNGENITAFIDNIVDKLFFTIITVGDELNAYTVFETLNARGVQLSAADLLKNYLFSIVDNGEAHEIEFDQLETLWSQTVDKLGNEKIPEFLRCYWNSKYKTTHKNDLFKVIKKRINTKKEVFDLLRDLRAKVDLFMALKNPEDEYWQGDIEIKTYLNELKVFETKQPISLLISAYDKLDKNDFKTILKICSVICFRYNVIGELNPNEAETVFNSIANSIANTSNFHKSDFLPIYPKDEIFQTDFANKELKRTNRNNKIIKYILAKIENRLSGRDIDFESEQNSIEHILPENPNESWEISDEALKRSRFRLGNLTLLEKSKNNQLQSADFQTKKTVFITSDFHITKKIGKNYGEWNESQIIKQQRILAKEAKTIWKIQF